MHAEQIARPKKNTYTNLLVQLRRPARALTRAAPALHKPTLRAPCHYLSRSHSSMGTAASAGLLCS